MIINVNLDKNSYGITVERGALARAGKYLNLNRRVLIVTDSGVPSEYAKTVARQCKEGVIFTALQGEGSKSLETFASLGIFFSIAEIVSVPASFDCCVFLAFSTVSLGIATAFSAFFAGLVGTFELFVVFTKFELS